MNDSGRQYGKGLDLVRVFHTPVSRAAISSLHASVGGAAAGISKGDDLQAIMGNAV